MPRTKAFKPDPFDKQWLAKRRRDHAAAAQRVRRIKARMEAAWLKMQVELDEAENAEYEARKYMQAAESNFARRYPEAGDDF